MGTKKTKLHGGKSFGKCSECGMEFLLKRKTKHKKGIAITNCKCPECSKKEREEKK